MADAQQKPGIWTAHTDAATGRTFYFNMVQNRSYWELPPELLAQVKTPAIDTLREWDPEAAARYEQPAATSEELERQRRKREEVLLQAADENAASAGAAPATALHERMAIAAAQKRAEEMKRLAREQKAKDDGSAAPDGQTNEYLSMVRELQAKDRDTESSGGKWLVR